MSCLASEQQVWERKRKANCEEELAHIWEQERKETKTETERGRRQKTSKQNNPVQTIKRLLDILVAYKVKLALWGNLCLGEPSRFQPLSGLSLITIYNKMQMQIH